MAKAEKTKSMIALETAGKAHKEAKEKHAKAETAATKTALEHAAKAHADAKRVVNRERFVKVGANRTGKAIIAVRNLGKVFNPRSYTFEKGDTDKVLSALRDEMAKLERTVTAALASDTGSKAEKEQVFSF